MSSDKSKDEEVRAAGKPIPSRMVSGARATATESGAFAQKDRAAVQKRPHEVAESIPRPLRRRKAAEGDAFRASGSLADLQAIVINLDRRPDRMEGCSARLAARCPGLHFTRFLASDGKVSPISQSEVATAWHTGRNVVYQKLRATRKGWNDLDTYQERHLDLSSGERGCAMSHIRAWRRCLELAGDTERPLLVLEDDAAPTEEFARLLSRAVAALPSDAGLLYLGYSQAADWRREVTPELVECEYVWTTVAYVVWPKCARQLLSKLPINEPVDNWMAALCAEGQLKAYAVRPKIVLQAEAWNINSDVAHSDEHYWGPCSDIHHSDEFYWGPADPRNDPSSVRLATGSCLLGLDESDTEDEI